jgi:hypothetical protein
MAFSKSISLFSIMLAGVLALVLARAAATQQPSRPERETAPSEPSPNNRQDAATRSAADPQAELNEASQTIARLQRQIQDLRAMISKNRASSSIGVETPTAKHDERPKSALTDSATKGQERAHPNQPTVRAGRYIFTASPTGNRAIAYDPVSREVKSVQLNATKDQPLRITPVTGPAVSLVALRLYGQKVTRIAAFDLKADRWVPLDLVEPVHGGVQPEYVGHGGTAYDLGRHVYTFSLPKGTWDHLDLQSIDDEAEGSVSGKGSQ